MPECMRESTSQPILDSVKSLQRFFLRHMNAQLEAVWNTSPKDDSLEYITLNGVSGIGLNGLKCNRQLSREERSEISETFEVILGGLIHLQERVHDLRRLEAHHVLHLTEEAQNVVPLQKPQNHRGSGQTPRPKDNSWVLKLDCLIESPSHSEIAKMARELHDHSQRMAFVEFRDLEDKFRTYPSEFSGLGMITVFVPDIFSLTRQQQFCLSQVIRQDVAHRPLLMVGTHMPYSLLKSDEHIQQDFLQLISRAYLKLTKTVAHYKSEGLLHYFLDSLT